ncbi:integral membrane protein [Plenodomus tracheiphilus IPT5]|uniref:Integral membrane protein n=1 Tax=Plenodomus tracheiphilus IPT5 TaxID=1408161 RepID=A0A6A7B5K7_9PLEO|nr:integral membrane protein [Plenodomus tracheiphilus IPT5]
MTAKLDAVAAVVVVFISIALYNFIELVVLILSTFKRRRGLYFWSFTISTCGIAFNSIGYLLKHLALTTNANLYATIILIGWCTMITGQSVVLYSRLHIVMHNARRLRAVLIMIVTNAIWLHLPIIILVYGVNSKSPEPFVHPYSIYEKIQLSVFVIQEVIISGLYVWETAKLVKSERTIGNVGTLRVMNHLIYVNVIVILLDVSILGLEFADLYEIQTAWKPLVYSVKLKLEFSILGRLVQLAKKARSGNSYTNPRNAEHSGGLALAELNQSQTRRRDGDMGLRSHYKVHVGGGKSKDDAAPPQESTVIKTTEVQVQSHSRRKNSATSLAESGEKILTDTSAHDDHMYDRRSQSSISSDPHAGKFENPDWR